MATDYTQPDGIGYDSMDDAATAAQYAFSRNFFDMKDREHAVIIYKNKKDGKYYRTFPVMGDDRSVHLQSTFDQLANDQIPVAVLHSHPTPSKEWPSYINDYLSDNDTQVGKGYGQDKNHNPVPVTTGRGPTGPMAMYLIRPDGTLSNGTGEMYRVGYKNPRTQQIETHPLQTTEGTLGQVPIQEILAATALRVQNSNLSPDMKARLLQHLSGQNNNYGPR